MMKHNKSKLLTNFIQNSSAISGHGGNKREMLIKISFSKKSRPCVGYL